jgi:hypothetical protein
MRRLSSLILPFAMDQMLEQKLVPLYRVVRRGIVTHRSFKSELRVTPELWINLTKGASVNTLIYKKSAADCNAPPSRMVSGGSPVF